MDTTPRSASGIGLVAARHVRYAEERMRDNGPVRRLTADALCGRFDASLRAGAEGVLASDGDGTLWRGDIGDALFDALVDEELLRGEARDSLAREATDAGLDGEGDSNTLARRLRDAYRAGTLEEARYFALQAWAAAGWEVRDLGAICSRVLDAFEFDVAVRPAMRRILEWSRERGLVFYLVSASPRYLLEEAVARLGLDPSKLVAMEPAQGAGRIEPRLASTPTYGPGKVERLNHVIRGEPLLAAFGDSAWDAAMLERAAYPVMIDPKPGLQAALAGFDGIFQLEES